MKFLIVVFLPDSPFINFEDSCQPPRLLFWSKFASPPVYSALLFCLKLGSIAFRSFLFFMSLRDINYPGKLERNPTRNYITKANQKNEWIDLRIGVRVIEATAIFWIFQSLILFFQFTSYLESLKNKTTMNRVNVKWNNWEKKYCWQEYLEV